MSVVKEIKFTEIDVDIDNEIDNEIEQVQLETTEDKIGGYSSSEKCASNTSKYLAVNVSDKQKKQAEDLHNMFAHFLEETTGITQKEEMVDTIPSGIDLFDSILGGGVARLFHLVGFPGSGKSALAARFIATGQLKWPGKFHAIYIDSEQSMSRERLEQLGVKYPPIVPYDKDVTVEHVFKIVENVCSFKEKNKELIDVPTLIVWDSVANTLTEKGMNEDNPSSVLGQKAAMLTHLLPKYVNKLNKYNIVLLCINQLRDKIEMDQFHRQRATLKFLADKNIPGGNSLLYNSFQLIVLYQKEPLKDTYGFDAVRVGARAAKNKLFSPNIEIDMVFSFERGYSNFWTNFELLKKYKAISVNGAWSSLKNYPELEKFQAKTLIKKYRDSEEFRNAWNNEVREVIQREIIDVYKGGSSIDADIGA